ncbi:MAG: glutamate 5-kinase [Deltaproteobacteria bacterium]|jgi:glutamate 5-kinase|nr:glutamate 5-kinase [Deltaproteobacteria bacterium]
MLKAKTQTIVIKLGTSVLTGGTRSLNRARMVEIVRQCFLARELGHRIILVTSGAVAAGREHLGFPDLPGGISSKQMLAAVGQCRLIHIWEQLFAIYGLNIGQMLLTRADLEDKERFLNARDMLNALLEHQIVPVINENDAVAITQIKVGNNDILGALAAVLASADQLLLLTDMPGLFTGDPRINPEAELIREIAKIDDTVRLLAGKSVSGLGTGGMSTKIQAADVATRAGIKVVIALGDKPELIAGIIAGENIGTTFLPAASPLENRKHWLFGASPSGELQVDAGAAKALKEQGGSLLPKGITGVSGTFTRGAVVRIVDQKNRELALGVAQYSSEAMSGIAGKYSNEIADILGYEHGPVAVHRDDLILLGANY